MFYRLLSLTLIKIVHIYILNIFYIHVNINILFLTQFCFNLTVQNIIFVIHARVIWNKFRGCILSFKHKYIEIFHHSQ